MGRVYVFADECGNFDFSRKQGASRYFILTTVTLGDCGVGDALLSLRRELAFSGEGLGSEFHATADKQNIRDRVFSAIRPHRFRVDATILDKAKAQPSIRNTNARFYQMAWYLHMKYVTPKITRPGDELLVVGAALGTKAERAAFHAAVADVVGQVCDRVSGKAASWAAASEPCLQVADYCAWAIQRKWEGGDDRSYVLIEDKVVSQFQPFKHGSTTYY